MENNQIKIEGKVILKKGREFSSLQGHPWIFSGALENRPRSYTGLELADGSVVEVVSHKEESIGLGFYNSKTSIAVRLFSVGADKAALDPQEIILGHLDAALTARDKWLTPETNCRRLVNAEGDSLPGLVVDQYGSHLVVQISTAGMESCRNLLLEFLKSKLSPESIYERSDSSSRTEEGLLQQVGSIFGETPSSDIVVQEGKLKLYVNLIEGQKTGFFIDQREMRKYVGEISTNKRVLNCFSYSGGFSIAALIAGADRVVSVDSSESAIALCAKNVELNQIASGLHEGKCANAFDYLGGTHERFDLVILDPPAFAKQRDHVRNALKAYRQINQSGMKLLKPGGILITSSCSNFITQDDFENEIFKVAGESNRRVSLVGYHRHAADHPVAVAHEQGAYLKSLVLLVN